MSLQILSLIDSFNPECLGGAARVCYEVNRELIHKGHSVQAICRSKDSNQLSVNGNQSGEFIFQSYPDIEGSQIKKVKYYRREIKKLFDKCLSQNKTDLIMIHSSSAAFGVFDDLKEIDVPIIYYFHSPWNREYEIIAGRNCCGIKSPVVSILSLIRKRHEKKYLNIASGIVTLSKSMQDILLEVHTSVTDKKLLIDPGAADIDKFYPVKDKEEKKSIRDELGLKPDDFLIITSRRLVPRTGVDVLIKAFAEVKKEHRAEGIEPFDGAQDRHRGGEKEHRTSTFAKATADRSNIQLPRSNEENGGTCLSRPKISKLILTGGGISTEDLKQLAVDLGVQDDIIFTGHVSEEDLAKYYRCSDLFVMPTKFLEGFGLSTVEAMASALPVIGTDIGGTPEILRKISDDLIIPECSVEAIAAKIAKFLTRDDLDIWRERSIQCFKENFTWERHVEKLLNFVENI